MAGAALQVDSVKECNPYNCTHSCKPLDVNLSSCLVLMRLVCEPTGCAQQGERKFLPYSALRCTLLLAFDPVVFFSLRLDARDAKSPCAVQKALRSLRALTFAGTKLCTAGESKPSHLDLLYSADDTVATGCHGQDGVSTGDKISAGKTWHLARRLQQVGCMQECPRQL